MVCLGMEYNLPNIWNCHCCMELTLKSMQTPECRHCGYENTCEHLCCMSNSICFSCGNTGSVVLHICEWEISGGSVIFPRNIICVSVFS